MVPVGAMEVSSALRMPCCGEAGADIVGQRQDMRAGEIFRRVEQREGAFLARQLDGGAIGGLAHGRKPALDQRHAFRRAIARAAEDQRIGKAGDAQPDAALGDGFLALGLQRKAGHVDGIVQHADRGGGEIRQRIQVEMGVRPRTGCAPAWPG